MNKNNEKDKITFDESKAFEFVSIMSERQITANEFFGTALLDAIDNYFGLKDTCIMFYNQNGEFLSWISRNGLLLAGAAHPYSKIEKEDFLRKTIYNKSVNLGLTYFNVTPQIYRGSDYVQIGSSAHNDLINAFKFSENCTYPLIMAFGINGYIQIVFMKSEEAGDFTDAEVEIFKKIYSCIAISYKNFKKHEHTKISSNIKDEIIKLGQDAYLITDDYMNILDYNELALKHLVEVLGPHVKTQMEKKEPCLWLPFLLNIDYEKDGIELVRIKEVRNKEFYIYNYDQSYSHGIIDRYHWITISSKDDKQTLEELKSVNLTTAENRVARLLCEGMTYQEIADTLVISYHTVKNHVQKIFFKCGIKNRYQLYKMFKNEDEQAESTNKK